MKKEKNFIKESTVIYKNTKRKIFPFYIEDKIALYHFVKTLLPFQPQECCVVIGVGSDLKVQDWTLLHRGTADSVQIDPAALLRWVLLTGCPRFFHAHNHPSGSEVVSDEDLTSHRSLQKAARTVGLHLVDGLIVTETKVISLNELVGEFVETNQRPKTLSAIVKGEI